MGKKPELVYCIGHTINHRLIFRKIIPPEKVRRGEEIADRIYQIAKNLEQEVASLPNVSLQLVDELQSFSLEALKFKAIMNNWFMDTKKEDPPS